MASAEEWIRRYAERIGIEPPDATEIEELLAMTGVAAHASERVAAPISAWLVGRAGLAPLEALEHARALAGEIEGEVEGGDGEPPGKGAAQG